MDILELLKQADAFLEGHFVLTSKKHSQYYIEKIKLIHRPDLLDKVADLIADSLKGKSSSFDTIVSPAYGAIALGFSVALKLGKKFVFSQRKEQEMIIRSGFKDLPGSNVYIVEDIITTGGSVLEVKDCIENLGANVQGIFCIIDRSGGVRIGGIEPESLKKLDITAYEPEECPLCKKGIPIIKPGSSDKK